MCHADDRWDEEPVLRTRGIARHCIPRNDNMVATVKY